MHATDLICCVILSNGDLCMKYKTGMVVEGKVTGIQPYGAFVSLDNQNAGLIHISEISDGFVKDISKYVQVGDHIKVKIIDFDKKHHQARLSLKALSKPRVRKARRQHVYQKPSLPPMKLGFQSIAANMDRWIEEAKENILNQ
jgi:general stress protein 13